MIMYIQTYCFIMSDVYLKTTENNYMIMSDWFARQSKYKFRISRRLCTQYKTSIRVYIVFVWYIVTLPFCSFFFFNHNIVDSSKANEPSNSGFSNGVAILPQNSYNYILFIYYSLKHILLGYIEYFLR